MVNYTPKNFPTTVCLKATNAASCVSETCKTITLGNVRSNVKKGFKLYPNPNNGNFNIEIDNPEKNILIEVYNSVGGLVEKVEMVEKVIPIAIGINLNVASGIYLVKMRNGVNVYYQKISVTDH